MPYIIPAGTTLPPPPTVVHSSDGLLTATLDAEFAGAQLFAQFPAAASVRFYRSDGTQVRSGSPAPAIGGEALAYDHEVPLGTYSAWYAVAYDTSGNILQTSATVQLFVPAPSNRTAVWLKSVTNPSLSVLVRAVNDIPGMSKAARQSTADVLGSPFPVLSLDAWSATSSDWQFLVETAVERKKLEACLTSGIVLVQSHPLVDFDDMFAVAGDVSREYAGSTIQQDQLVSVTFTEVARPAVEGSPLLTPGRTWRWLVDHQETWATVRDSYDSWLDVAGLPVS